MSVRCAEARPSTCRRSDRCAATVLGALGAIDSKRFIFSAAAWTAAALWIWQRRRAARLAHAIAAADEMLEQFREAETADLT